MKNHNRRKSPSAVPSAPVSDHCDAIHRRRVLAVDDNPELRRLISLYLQRHGYEVSLAENGVVERTDLFDHPPNAAYRRRLAASPS